MPKGAQGLITAGERRHAAALDAAFAHHGDYVDELTGLELKEARWYAPKLGRFLSEDPLGFADGGNPYRFAGNDPINFADPTGTTQAGYPLAGGYSGGKVVSQPVYNSVATAFAGGLGGLGGFASSVGTASYSAPKSYSTSYSTPILTSQSFATPARSAATLGGSSSARSNSVIREIAPGARTITTPVNDLPIVLQQSVKQPDRYATSYAGGNGYFVLDTHEGSVRYAVPGEQQLPIVTQQRLTANRGQDSRAQTFLWDVAGEAAISASPIHETARDMGVLYAGYDYWNPSRTVTLDDRRMAAIGLALPGFNSGQRNVAQEVLDGMTHYHDDAARIFTQQFDAAVPKGGVYLLRDPVSGEVVRTGRSADLMSRRGDHLRDPMLKDFDFEAVHRTDSYAEQRGLEQHLHDAHTPPLNYRRPIDPQNPRRQGYMDAANAYLRNYND